MTFARSSCKDGTTDVLLIDIDVPFDVFKQRFLDAWRGLLDYVAKAYEVTPRLLIVSRSRSGNTHVTLAIRECVSYEKALLLKFLLGDDRKRIALELWRLENIGDPWDFFHRGSGKDAMVMYF